MAITDWQFDKDRKQWDFSLGDGHVIRQENLLWTAFYDGRNLGQSKDEQAAMRLIETEHTKASFGGL
jgi:hypothetical protein